MGNFYSQITPLTFEENQKRALENAKTYGKFQPITDTWEGFREENLIVMGAEELLDKSNFQADANYIPKNDPQLEGYDFMMDQFLFSRSAAETTSILEDLKHNAEVQKESPFYFLGRLLGAFADPSTLLLWTKFGRGAMVFGSAVTTEEFIKQNLDQTRSDDIVPFVATAGFVLPAIINKFSSPVPNKIIDDAIAKGRIIKKAKNSKKEIS